MIVERTENEVLVRLSSRITDEDIEDLFDYMQAKEIVAKSRINEDEAKDLLRDIEESISIQYKNHKKDRGL